MVEKIVINLWKTAFFLVGGERRTVSAVMASPGETKLLKTSIAGDRWWTD